MIRRRKRAVDNRVPNNRSADSRAAGTVFLVMVSILALGALLNAAPMRHRVETSELGSRRDAGLAFWRPVEQFSTALRLDRPRALLDTMTGREIPPPQPDLTDTPAVAAGRLGHAPYSPPPAGPRLLEEPNPDQPSLETPLGLPLPLPPATSTTPTSTTPTSTTPPSTTPTSTTPPSTTPTSTTPPPTTLRSTTTAPTSSTLPSEPTLRRPTAEDPLRVLVIGDSTMDAVGTAILRQLAESGVTDSQLDFRISTGLSRPDFFDWPAHLSRVTAEQQTEVVMIMIGANDAQPFLTADGAEEYGTERWFEIYRQRVSTVLDQLTATGSWVIWIGQPPMRNGQLDAKLGQLNEIYASEIDRHPTASYVDSRSVLGGGDGSFAAYLDDGAGNQVLVRQGDGVHLTPDGGDRLAPLVLSELATMMG